jgi:hypothetical protein
LTAQTRKPDEIIVLASNIDLSRVSKRFPSVRFIREENKSDWGHDKRAKGLDLATSDYVGWFNHDDSYSKTYVEVMMDTVDRGFDVAFCGWNSNSTPEFRSGSSTSGNYIVRTSIGRSAGYLDRHYEADGTFIDRIAAKTSAIKFVPEVLYFHNEVK